jgi:ABC-2 type transport system ATP-binding protein
MRNPTITMPDALRGAAVALTGLRRSYGSVPAVDGVDLTIAPGEVVALLGPNGAGKSTTVDMLLGLARPDGGTAHLFGRTPREAVQAGRIGAMLQDGALLEDATVAETVGGKTGAANQGGGGTDRRGTRLALAASVHRSVTVLSP